MKSPLSRTSDASLRLTPVRRLKFSGNPAGTVEGYASTFNDSPDSYGDVIAPGAFARTLAEHKASGSMPLMLWQHRAAEPIGRWTDMREDARGLYVVGELNLDTSRGRDTHAHVRAGDISGLSIGFFIASGGHEERPDGFSLLKDLDLVEVSVVSFPANGNARITGAKNLQSKNELVALLREAGLSKVAAQRVAAGGWPALVNEDQSKAAELAERIARATADMTKATELAERIARVTAELKASL